MNDLNMVKEKIKNMDDKTLLKAVWEYVGDELMEDEDFINYLFEMGYME